MARTRFQTRNIVTLFCSVIIMLGLGTGYCNLVTAEVCVYALAAGRKGFIGISPGVFHLSLHQGIASV